ncbi:MAG: ABC transporter permease, partial [Clostridium sp.]|nr:ABC transporter permease [Clostridium sp.]
QSLLEVLPAEAQSGENGKRLFIDAYSSLGRITVNSEKGSLEANAVGIGGDFFLFHPLQLVSGGYFSGSDLMKDSIILDEDAAWQLFGSNDIAGKSVTIGDIPHYVSGVVKRQTGRFAENAGLGETVIYVSNETLSAYGKSGGINVYEVTAPNPVKGFVYKCVKEKLGVEESNMLVVENSARYSLEALIPVILEFGGRSMQNSAVKFPYWENIARGWEDIKALILLFQFIFLLIPAVIVTVFLVIKWKNRNFTWKDVGNFIIDTKERITRRAESEKDKWEHF